MRKPGKEMLGYFALAGLLGMVHPVGVLSVEGVVLIDQAGAGAGGVTPGDAAGFPVTISKAGSYRLASNLTVPDANTAAIEIITSDVTLDLNGFRIKGPTVCSGAPLSCEPFGTGIGVKAVKRKNITVRNGTVRGMGKDGLQLGANSRIEQITAISNGGDGIGVDEGSTVTDSIATNNGGSGIIAALSSTVTNNTTTRNRIAGIVGSSSTVTNNTANSNGGIGIIAQVSLVLGNTASFNGGDGILSAGGSGSLVLQNTALGNAGFGLNLAGNSGYADNVLNANNGDNLSPQISGGIEIGTNICGGNTICP